MCKQRLRSSWASEYRSPWSRRVMKIGTSFFLPEIIYMLKLFFMLSLFSCDNKIDDTADGVVTREEEPIPESLPEDQPWGYEPDMVLFHNVTVVTNGGDVSCFDDGDGTPYCGVHKIYLTVWDDWGGLGDQGSCEITHRVAPEYLLSNGENQAMIDVGGLVGWEMDATQSFVGMSTMCDFIREGTPQYTVLERFKTENPIWGIIMPTGEMMAEYRENHTSYTDEEWAQDVAPYLMAHVNKVGGDYRVPNMSVAFQISDEDNLPLTDTDGNLIAGVINDINLVNGYYRSPPFYVYGLDRFVVGE